MHKVLVVIYIIFEPHILGDMCGSFFRCKLMKKIYTVLIVLMILICIPATVPRILGYEIYNVVSGSMEPQIHVGSAVFVFKDAPENIKEKDVISFYSGTMSQGIITHRVVENCLDDRIFITKGDANLQQDILPVAYTRYIGKVVFSIPLYGYFAGFISSFTGKIVMIIVVFLLLLLYFLEERKKNSGEDYEK